MRRVSKFGLRTIVFLFEGINDLCCQAAHRIIIMRLLLNVRKWV